MHCIFFAVSLKPSLMGFGLQTQSITAKRPFSKCPGLQGVCVAVVWQGDW